MLVWIDEMIGSVSNIQIQTFLPNTIGNKKKNTLTFIIFFPHPWVTFSYPGFDVFNFLNIQINLPLALRHKVYLLLLVRLCAVNQKKANL